MLVLFCFFFLRHANFNMAQWTSAKLYAALDKGANKHITTDKMLPVQL